MNPSDESDALAAAWAAQEDCEHAMHDMDSDEYLNTDGEDNGTDIL